MTTSRVLLSGSDSDRNQHKELLRSIFVAELTSPSSVIWLVSPWISDIPVIEDSSEGFASIIGGPGASLTLSEGLARLAARGTTIRIVTRPREAEDFTSALHRHLAQRPCKERVRVQKIEDLHTKSLVGDGYQVRGSMNFTFNGMERNHELTEFDTEPALNAELKMGFERLYGD